MNKEELIAKQTELSNQFDELTNQRNELVQQVQSNNQQISGIEDQQKVLQGKNLAYQEIIDSMEIKPEKAKK